MRIIFCGLWSITQCLILSPSGLTPCTVTGTAGNFLRCSKQDKAQLVIMEGKQSSGKEKHSTPPSACTSLGLLLDHGWFASKICWGSALTPQEDEISNWIFPVVLPTYFNNPSCGYPAVHIHAFQLLLASLFGICLHENPFPSGRSDLLYIWHGSHEQYFFHCSHLFFHRVIWGFRNMYVLAAWYTCAADGVEKWWRMCGGKFSRQWIAK